MNLFKSSFLLAAAMLMGFASCSSDEPENGGGNTGAEGEFHAQIHLRLPGASRSTTLPDDDPNYDYPEHVSSDDYEYGQTYENSVNDVTIVLATLENGRYIPQAVSTSSAVPDAGYTNEDPVFNIRFRNDDVVKLHDQKVYLFAFCNAQAYLDPETDFTSADFVNKIIEITSATPNEGIWKEGNFLMANAPDSHIQYKLFPGEDDLKKNYNTAEKALNLGTIEVARVMSRFDFKVVNNNEYNIYDVNPDADGNQVLVGQVKLLAMAPLNVAKEFYLLPRVSDDGTDNNWELCGAEYFSNWVVTPYWADKTTNGLSAEMLARYFYPAPGRPYTDAIYKYTPMSFFNNAQDDFDENWGSGMSGEAKSGYKIWRYVTENTLPSSTSQKLGTSTGVVFKAEITAAPTGTILAAAMAEKKAIYSYNGTMYGSIASLRKLVASIDNANPLRQAFKAVFPANYLEVDEDGAFVVADADLMDCSPADNANTFKIYRPTVENGQAHYYVYYTYRNRHNDNRNSNVMGAMEFGTVRNNIYKLAVTNITDFGHTGDPDDDPDPEDPNDPDEDPKTYLKVSCRVVPWMVRVNNIEF